MGKIFISEHIMNEKPTSEAFVQSNTSMIFCNPCALEQDKYV